LSSIWLEQPDACFPCITLSASGGHTDLWYRESHTRGTLLGRTLDDAAGEAFDKGAAQLGLPYPGGPAISHLAEEGDPESFLFPLPLRNEPGFNFSFSGLKTALRNTLRDAEPHSDLAASFQEAICNHLVDRISKACTQHPDAKEVHLVGGVSANTRLRELVTKAAKIPVRFPTEIRYCTDNAAMIGAAAFFLQQEIGDDAFSTFETEASIPLESLLKG
jgi:N6-L-threonylcarbamoyladenine synthase